MDEREIYLKLQADAEAKRRADDDYSRRALSGELDAAEIGRQQVEREKSDFDARAERPVMSGYTSFLDQPVQILEYSSESQHESSGPKTRIVKKKCIDIRFFKIRYG
jgi:hypothetical protein